jgi:hypothetical protein
MEQEKKIITYIPSFLEKIKKDKLSNSSIIKKKREILFFEKWLINEKLENILPKQFEKKYLLEFKKELSKKKLKESTILGYLKTVQDFIEYLSENNIFSPTQSKKPESDVQQIVNHYFATKGFSLEDIKESAKKKKIIYSRYTKPAKDILELSGSVKRAKNAITTIALWANSRKLDYAIETVIKKWPEIKKLKPKEKEKKAYFRGDLMIWSKNKQKWFVVGNSGDWLEFAGDEKDIEWRIED